MPTIGSHWILEMYDCPADLLDDLERVRAAIRGAARAARSTLLHESAHRFEPQGVTALGLLAESHISIHTWPELGYAAADLFVCGQNARPRDACEYLAMTLGAGRTEVRHFERGMVMSQPRPMREPTRTPAEVEAASDAPIGGRR